MLCRLPFAPLQVLQEIKCFLILRYVNRLEDPLNYCVPHNGNMRTETSFEQRNSSGSLNLQSRLRQRRPSAARITHLRA